MNGQRKLAVPFFIAQKQCPAALREDEKGSACRPSQERSAQPGSLRTLICFVKAGIPTQPRLRSGPRISCLRNPGHHYFLCAGIFRQAARY